MADEANAAAVTHLTAKKRVTRLKCFYCKIRIPINNKSTSMIRHLQWFHNDQFESFKKSGSVNPLVSGVITAY